jgi:hypothetical protein
MTYPPIAYALMTHPSLTAKGLQFQAWLKKVQFEQLFRFASVSEPLLSNDIRQRSTVRSTHIKITKPKILSILCHQDFVKKKNLRYF